MAARLIHILCVVVLALRLAEALPASGKSRLMRAAARHSSIILDDGRVQTEQSRLMPTAGRSSLILDDDSVRFEVPPPPAEVPTTASTDKAKQEPETSPASLVDGTPNPDPEKGYWVWRNGSRSYLNETNLNFGGRDDIQFPKRTDPMHSFPRPEYSKSVVCTDSVCEDCATEGAYGCWRGGAVHESWANFINVPWNDTHDSHVLDVWARCNGSEGKWQVTATKMKNAEMEVYVDGVMVDVLVFNKTLTLSIKTGEARVRVVFRRVKRDRNAVARIVLIAVDVAESFDECMSHKVCLDELGDESNASLVFRNTNSMQKHCLEEETDTMNTEEQEKCTLWKMCLSEDMKNTLLTFLRAAIPNRTKSMIEVKGDHDEDEDEDDYEVTTKDDPNSCVDPASDDPESWYCECLPEMITTCNDEVDEVCFRGIFCDHASVCQHWKDDNCDSSLMAVAIKRRSAVNSSTTGGTDNTLQGKCGSNEV